MKSSPVMRLMARWAARSYLGRPDQAEIIEIKYPRLRDLPSAFVNEFCFRRRSTRAFRLTALNVELTSRCNLSCSICPRHSAGGTDGDDLDFGTFCKIVDSTPHLRVLLPYQWGEPLLSPVLFDAVAYAAVRGVRVMVTTNGTLLDRQKAQSLIDAGLERLTVSFDGSAETQEMIRGAGSSEILEKVRLFDDVRRRARRGCALDVSMVVDELTEPFVREFAATFEGLADRIQYIPRFVRTPRRTACREPWRGQMVVLANGDVTVCCVDSRGDAVLGNVGDRMPVEWFNSPEMQAFRKSHIERDLPDLCANCGEYTSDSVSARF